MTKKKVTYKNLTKKEFIARKLGEKLSYYDWTIFDSMQECLKCHIKCYQDDRFCKQCGTKLELNKKDPEIIDQLYKAFQAGKRAEKEYDSKG